MSVIKNIKCKIGHYNLRKELKNQKRYVKTHNFNTAKSVGILFSSPYEESFKAIKDFSLFLSDLEIKVIALG